MALTSLGLIEDLLNELFRADDLRILLSRHDWAMDVVKSVPGETYDPAKVVHRVAEALLKQGLVTDHLLPVLRTARPYQMEAINAFTANFAVSETAALLARLSREALYDWASLSAPSALDRRLSGKAKDASTVSAQLSHLNLREREAVLLAMQPLWPLHSVEQSVLRNLCKLWTIVPEPQATPLPQTLPGTPQRVDPNDLRQFIRTLDRERAWGALLMACRRPTHQLLVLRGDPNQSLSYFRDRVKHYLSTQSTDHNVRCFGPGQDHLPASTVTAWEELLCDAIGRPNASLHHALSYDTERLPAMYIIGLNGPLRTGAEGISEDELSALERFIVGLPKLLPGLRHPLRLLLPVQVDAGLGAEDPLFVRLEAAIEAAEAEAPELVQAVSVGALALPPYDELRETIHQRARGRFMRSLSPDEWAAVKGAHTRAEAARAPFLGLAQAIWDALPDWMKVPQ